MNTDLIRFVDSISRDKNIDKESIFVDLEAAMVSAVRKANEMAEDVEVRIDRTSGEIRAVVDAAPVDMKTLGRIAAQTAKQVMIQKIREDERNSIFEEYSQRVGMVVTGTVVRYDGGGLAVNLGRVEAFMPRSEMIPGEAHHPGERIRGMILDVREDQSQVRIVLTQTHPDYIRKLFELEVPEVSDHTIEIRALAREAGYRTKIAVSSIDSRVDAVGACVGVRGSRIRNIVDELGGEKIDIVRWNESSQVLISNALKPAEVKEIFLCFELGKATVVVDEEQLSLAIGKRGQNVRLAARLTGWDIDIMTPAEYDKCVDDMERVLKDIEGVGDVMLDKLLAFGVVSLGDLAEVGAEPLVEGLELEETLANTIIEIAAREAKRIAAETEAAKAAAQMAAQQLEGVAVETVATEPEAQPQTSDTLEPVVTGLEVGTAPTPSEPTPSEPTDGEPTPGDLATATSDDEEPSPEASPSAPSDEVPEEERGDSNAPRPAGTVELADPT